MHMRYSTMSPQTCDIGAQAPTNEHIERLASILLTYNLYEKELGEYIDTCSSTTANQADVYEGYVQGMSDLCAPVYVVMDGDEELTFWCFVEIMDRMVRTCITTASAAHAKLGLRLQKQNFLRDQSGMRKQLSTLQQLIAVMDPELYRHLGTVNGCCNAFR